MIKFQFIFIILICLTPLLGWGQTPIGVWKAYDSEHNNPRSLIKIYKKDNGLWGKVIKLFRTPEENKNPLCFNCKKNDSRYNQPVLGMVLLKNLRKKNSTRWDQGEVLDPDTGNIYRCYLEMISEDQLKVRGCLGFSLFGRTKYMYRVEEYEEGTVEIINTPQ